MGSNKKAVRFPESPKTNFHVVLLLQNRKKAIGLSYKQIMSRLEKHILTADEKIAFPNEYFIPPSEIRSLQKWIMGQATPSRLDTFVLCKTGLDMDNQTTNEVLRLLGYRPVIMAINNKEH